jgi:glycosyltransferase involved in cell wall biosynthesis
MSSNDRSSTEPAGHLNHGLGSWPFETRSARSLPAGLPDGRNLPNVAIVVFGGADADPSGATLASIARQDYPGTAIVEASQQPEEPESDAIARCIVDLDVDYLVFIKRGDLLAPGAVAALVVTVLVEKADLVTGLHVVCDDVGVRWLDAQSFTGPIDEANDSSIDELVSQGRAPLSGLLIAYSAVRRAGGLVAGPSESPHDFWKRLQAAGATVAVTGRPVLVTQIARNVADRALLPRWRVAAVNDRGFQGGAGIAHRRLIETLRCAGHDVTQVTLAGDGSPLAAEWTDAFPKAERAVAEGHFDFVLAGNIHGATRGVSVLERLGRAAPVLAVLHDLYLLTGRCAAPLDCPLLETGCDEHCPRPDVYPELAPSRIADAYGRKRALLASSAGPILLANSRWTAERARQLAPEQTAIETINLAFPTQVFQPADRTALRRRLGLPVDDVLIIVCSVILGALGKGSQAAIDLARRVVQPGVGVVAIGRIDDGSAFRFPGLYAPGPITDEAELAAWFGACDIHITMSRVETLGQTPIEAALCGTPTVACREGGLTTAVIDGLSGRLVDTDIEAVAVIEELIRDTAARRAMGALGQVACEARNSFAGAYLDLCRVLVRRSVVSSPGARIRMAPGMLRMFAFSDDPISGGDSLVPQACGALYARVRRLRLMLWGWGRPLWLRRAVYIADRVRRRLREACR